MVNADETKLPHIKLDDIDLVKRTDEKGAVKEIRSIGGLSVYGGRSIVELPIPGSVGNVLQDMGRSPLVVAFNGILHGPDAMKTLKEVKQKFELGKPIPFSSDIAMIGDINKVIIEKFNVHFDGGITLDVRYSMVLKEFIPNAREHTKEKEEESEPPSQEEEAKDEVDQKSEDEFNKTQTEWVEYTIKKGDTLSEIAESYDMSWQDLYNGDGGSGTTNEERLNQQKQEKGRPKKSIDNPDLIYPDDIILVPNQEPKARKKKEGNVHASDKVQYSSSDNQNIKAPSGYLRLYEVKIDKAISGTIRVNVKAMLEGVSNGHFVFGKKSQFKGGDFGSAPEGTLMGQVMSQKRAEAGQCEDADFNCGGDYLELSNDLEVDFDAGDILELGVFYEKETLEKYPTDSDIDSYNFPKEKAEKHKYYSRKVKEIGLKDEEQINVKDLQICFEPDIGVTFTEQHIDPKDRLVKEHD